MIELDDVRAAAERLAPRLRPTPFLHSRVLSELTGAHVMVKFENHQFTASFKERGALNKLLTLDADQRARGVSAMSAGNHAQGVAYHAKQLGIPATIVMPAATPSVKVEHTKAHGATVILAGETLAEANAEAERVTRERSLTFIHPFDDPEVMAGQGTVALEMLDVCPDLEAIVCPIGGGGLISGVATAAKGVRPGIEVVGVQAACYPSMLCELRGEPLQGEGNTIAEGIAVKFPGKLTSEVVRARVDAVLLVEEPQLEEAVALYLFVEKTVAEGAGAAALAALLARPTRFKNRKVGLILSGGNIDPRLLAQVITRQLIRDGRIVTLRLTLGDRPGGLARVTGVLRDLGANIMEIQHHRMLLALPAKEASIEISFEARDREHGQSVVDALRAAGFTPVVV
uniref:Threonine dehydratase, medium form n=1 Tax=Desulfovibrio sp. U5L TaxID=596152 RepID=I2Q3M6_9BACT